MGLVFVSSGCAILHSVQLGEIDSEAVLTSRPFEIKVSEFGLSTQDIATIGQALAQQSGHSDEVAAAGGIIEMFQMGPKTGNPSFKDDYSDHIKTLLLKECPNGKITGLMAIRETAKYPVISGEIVRVSGYCLQD